MPGGLQGPLQCHESGCRFWEAFATPAFNCLLDIVNVAHASLCPEALCLAWDCLDRLGSSSRGASATAGVSLVCSWAGRFTGTWLVRCQAFDVIGRDAWDVRVLWALRSYTGQLLYLGLVPLLGAACNWVGLPQHLKHGRVRAFERRV
jgi:hypothetical protein